MEANAKKSLLIAMLITAFLMAGCATREVVRIDSSTEESFNRSYQQMSRSLTRTQQSELSAAVMRIAMMGTGSFSEFAQRFPGGSFSPADIKDELDGKTFQEILELAEQSEVQAIPVTSPSG